MISCKIVVFIDYFTDVVRFVLVCCRLPYTFVTTDVAEATCACLLAQLEEADRLKMPEVVQERMVIEEFGRCLMQIIDSANKTKGKFRALKIGGNDVIP